ncbi:oligosaccharide flippase family protein [Geodermatophilus saharensis]|uniref:oligosaccharide flippase family protein n=1 Tax=Geodermatophilus saharensis TaxID=1137994 RepID=UPI001C3D2CD5|nr:oligosaccharide flippase family protein [Geodermatophilus saharensis]
MSRLSTLAIGIVLARILGPAEFGTYAVALLVLMALLSINELGVSLAIVRWPGDPREIAPTVATLSVAGSVLVYALCAGLAPVLAGLVGEPDAVPVIRLLGLGAVISGVVATPAAMLQRDLRQRRKMVIDQVGAWVSALTSLACALSGLGAVSLAVGHLAGTLVGAALFIAAVPGAVRLGFDRVHARALLRFGLPLAGASAVVFAVGNVDRLVVGAVLGPVPLGVYVLAANLSLWPVSVFSQPVRAVAPALFARLQHDPVAMRSTFTAWAALLAAVALPACALLAGAAGSLVPLVYGSAWSAAAGVLPWLAVAAALRILFELAYDLLVVLARTRTALVAQVAWLVAAVPATVVGAHLAGLSGTAAAQVAVTGLVVLPVYLAGLRRAGISVGTLAARVSPAVLVAAAVAVLGWVVVVRVDSDPVAVLTSTAMAGAGALVLLFRERSTLRGFRASRSVDSPSDEAVAAGEVPVDGALGLPLSADSTPMSPPVAGPLRHAPSR